MRWTRIAQKTSVHDAYGEVVWSWRRGAGVKFHESHRGMTVAKDPFTGEITL